MRLLILLIVTIAAAYGLPVVNLEQEWSDFKLNHGKIYESHAEESKRFQIFAQNLQKINEHNKKFDKGLTSYKMGVNQFTDLTREEFKELYLTGLKISEVGDFHVEQYTPPANVSLPSKLDWRDKGAVTPVKNQEMCGSCWSFSAIAALESQHFIRTGKLISLSEQNVVDCSFPQGNQGCGGGLPILAYKYIAEQRGIDSEDMYPYLGVDSICEYDPESAVVTVDGAITIERGNEKHLEAALALVGPVSIAISADYAFMTYKEGILDGNQCRNERKFLNHAVLAVGYGTNGAGQDYWIVKNSWGTKWGMNGYILMPRNQNNTCGIATLAVLPVDY